MRHTTLSSELFREACKVIPGGVNSPTRSFAAVGGAPRVIERASGCFLYDVDNNRLVDYIGSWGAMILGHAHPRVVHDITRAATNGTSFGTPNPLEAVVAKEVVARVPSIDKVRFVNSGTEGVLSALRLARAATARQLIVKVRGCYHGNVDDLLADSGSGVSALGSTDAIGTSDNSRTVSVPYNDVLALRRTFDERGCEIAALILEPVPANMGVVPPLDGFLDEARQLTARTGALLIFDEVITGFRLAPGGAQEQLGITPDITILGKVLGGGLPVGAYGASRSLMDMLTPLGNVYQGGTFSGNPLTMAAAHATLALLGRESYATLDHRTENLQRGLVELMSRERVVGTVQRMGSMLTLYFGVEKVDNFTDAQHCDKVLYARFFHEMLTLGVHLPPSPLEAWFVSLAHVDADIDFTLDCAKRALRSMRDLPLTLRRDEAARRDHAPRT